MHQQSIAIYAGSFDPPTNGHLDLVERASLLFHRVIVAVGRHPTRVPLFSVEERMKLLQASCEELSRSLAAQALPSARPPASATAPEGLRVSAEPLANVEVDAFDELLIHYARRRGARVIVRGLRAQTDFEYELQIAHANADLAPDLDTVFLPTRTRHGFVSASLVREIARHHGDVSHYVPVVVRSALEQKFSARG
jgi:pantetheine-phosphate adenylyltransferase